MRLSNFLSYGAAFLLLILFACGLVWLDGDAIAQLPAPNPLVAPLPPPVTPAPLTAPVQPQGVPSLVAVPTPQPTSSVSAARVFNCSCFGAGIGTRWMGMVSAPSYFAARQTATGACLTYNESKEPAAPTINTHANSSLGPALTLPQGFEEPNAGASPGLPGGVEVSTAGELNSCSQCVCD